MLEAALRELEAVLRELEAALRELEAALRELEVALRGWKLRAGIPVKSFWRIHMKKILIFFTAFLLLIPAIFADDAKVMPALVGRLYAAPIFSFAPGYYDDDGNYESFSGGSVRLFNLGFALEFGILNWLTAAVQWVPGWTPWSDITPAVDLPFAGDYNTNGFGDIFAGAKIQLIGANAPLKSSMLRFALAPGVIIPLPGPDFEKEFNNAAAGNNATLNNMDKHVFGAGGRFYFDYVINDKFFINFYNETIFYPIAADLNKAGPTFAGAKMGIPAGIYDSVLSATSNAGMAAAAAGLAQTGLQNASGEVDYGYRLTFEIEPVFSTFLVDGVQFTAGLPINYRYSPAPKYSVSNVVENPALESFGINLESLLLNTLEGEASHVLSINPNLGIFLMRLPLPLEFKFQYNIPVFGINTNAQHNMTLQIRAYFAFRRS